MCASLRSSSVLIQARCRGSAALSKAPQTRCSPIVFGGCTLAHSQITPGGGEDKCASPADCSLPPETRYARPEGPTAGARPAASRVFASERGGPTTPKAFHALVARIGSRAKMPFPVHPHMLRHGCGFARANAGPRHSSFAGLARAQEHPAHGPLHRAGARSVQNFLEIASRSAKVRELASEVPCSGEAIFASCRVVALVGY